MLYNNHIAPAYGIENEARGHRSL